MAYTTIDDPSVYFQAKTYTGTQNSHAITLDGNSNLSPNWVWIKCRDDSHNHQIFDTVRGVNKRIRADANTVETSSVESLKSFDSDGFTLGTQANVNANASGDNSFVAWCWKESTTAGFDIIAYEGTGSNLDVAHNLSAIPDWIMIKDRDVDQAWRVYSKSLGYSNRVVLSESGASSTSALGLDADPTSSVINIGTGTGTTNTDDDKYIIYAFKNVKGFSRFSSYVGNGNASGPYIHLGFKPAFILGKKSSGSNNWYMFDSTRNTFNLTTKKLRADANGAEDDNTSKAIDMLSNGYKIRTADEEFNDSGETYIYIAYAENPFVTSTGIPTPAR